MADSWWLALPERVALPDFDCEDGIVPEVLSKLIYKWSSYILISIYSWRQVNITVNSLAKMIGTYQQLLCARQSRTTPFVEAKSWLTNRQNWRIENLRKSSCLRIPRKWLEGNMNERMNEWGVPKYNYPHVMRGATLSRRMRKRFKTHWLVCGG